MLIFGAVVAGACTAASAALVAFDQFLDDNRWTAKVLLVLAGLALLLALWDRRGVRAVRRHERRLLASLGASSYEAMLRQRRPASRRGAPAPAAGVGCRAHDTMAAQWRLITGGAPLHWALDHRPAIVALAERRQQAAPFLATDLAHEESSLADAARLLVERVVALRHVGATGERLPLVLDEPFIGLDQGDTVRLLETIRRLAAFHQILLVTGDHEVEAWATHLASTGQLAVVRPAPRPPATSRRGHPTTPPPGPIPPAHGAASSPRGHRRHTERILQREGAVVECPADDDAGEAPPGLLEVRQRGDVGEGAHTARRHHRRGGGSEQRTVELQVGPLERAVHRDLGHDEGGRRRAVSKRCSTSTTSSPEPRSQPRTATSRPRTSSPTATRPAARAAAW